MGGSGQVWLGQVAGGVVSEKLQTFRSIERARRDFVGKEGSGQRMGALGKEWGGLGKECILWAKRKFLWAKKNASLKNLMAGPFTRGALVPSFALCLAR